MQSASAVYKTNGIGCLEEDVVSSSVCRAERRNIRPSGAEMEHSRKLHFALWTTGNQPIQVEELATRLVDPLIRVGSEVVALGL